MPARKLDIADSVQRPAHRPEFSPAPEQREMVKLMVAGGIQQAAIAGALGISEPTLRKHFREEIDHGAAQVNAIVVAAHFKRIQDGDMRAIEWWEKSRMGWSEKMTFDDGQGNAPMRVVVELVGEPAPKTIEHAGSHRSSFDAANYVEFVG